LFTRRAQRENDARTHRTPKHFVRNPREALFCFAAAFGVRARPRGAALHNPRLSVSIRPSETAVSTTRWTQLFLSRHPMQGQRRNEKKEYHDDAQLNEKQQHQISKFLFVDLEEARRPGCGGVPEEQRRSEIEQDEDETDDKCCVKEVPEENDFVALHASIIYFSTEINYK
jgi:hypothetical protein